MVSLLLQSVAVPFYGYVNEESWGRGYGEYCGIWMGNILIHLENMECNSHKNVGEDGIPMGP